MNTKRLFIINFLNAVIPSTHLNVFKSKLYRWAGVMVGDHCEFFQGAKIIGNGSVMIGNNVFVGFDSRIIASEGSHIIIEDNTIIGTEAMIITGYHPITVEGPRILGYEGIPSTCIVHKGASLGTRAILLPNVSMGEMSEAVAGSVITHDVPSYTRVAGVPAKSIKVFKEAIMGSN